MDIILVERLKVNKKGSLKKTFWLVFIGKKMPKLEIAYQKYLRRFAVDHWYRFIKQRLHGTLPALSTPQQCERWSDLMPLMTWQLWLAKDIVQENHLQLAKTSEKFNTWKGCTVDARAFSNHGNSRTYSQTPWKIHWMENREKKKQTNSLSCCQKRQSFY